MLTRFLNKRISTFLPLCAVLTLASCGPKTESATGISKPTSTPAPPGVTTTSNVPQDTPPVIVDTTPTSTPQQDAPPQVSTSRDPAPGVTITTTTTSTAAAPDPAEPTPTYINPPPMGPIVQNPLVNQENLDRIHKDMAPSQVEAILGRPTDSQTSSVPILGGTETTYHYDYGSASVTIIFRNDMVKFKSGHFGD